MALQKIRLGTNEDGSPLYHYAGEHVVITGAATGEVTLPDGSTVDVTDSVIEANSPEHAQAIAQAIAEQVGAADGTEVAPAPAAPTSDVVTGGTV